MRLVVEKVTKCSGRLCSIDLESAAKKLQTPLLLLYTKLGSIPHISREVFEDCFGPCQDEVLLISVANSCLAEEPCRAFGRGIAEFAGLKGAASVLTLKDVGEHSATPGYKEPNAMGIFTRSGKLIVNSGMHMRVVEAFKPTFCEFLTDAETEKACSRKRVIKSVDRTQTFFEECRDLQTGEKITSKVIANVVGGLNEEERARMLQFLKQNEDVFEGFCVDGLHANGHSAAQLEIESIQDIVKQSLKALPESKLRLMYGAYSPLALLHLVKSGIDVFDSSYAYLATESHYALAFSLSHDITANGNGESRHNFAINLSEGQFKEDLTPLVSGCSCLTCRKHTKAYLNHLINCKELLASTLLMIHNLHHYKEFFKAIRRAIESETLDQMIQVMTKEYVPLKLEKAAPQVGKKKENARRLSSGE